MKQILTIILLLASSIAHSATEFTVHHNPGGPSDKVTRLVHKYLPSEKYVVVNRPGAQGKIAVKHIMSHDSMMLATMGQIYVTNQLTSNDYNPNTDLKVVASVGVMPSVLVCRSDLNIKSVPDIIKSKELSFAVAGYGSSEHLATEVLFNKMNRKHLIVPYSAGGSKSVMDMLGGHIDCMFANYPTVKEFLSDKRLTTIMSSHELGLNTSTWQEMYSESFPMQATLAIVVGKNNTNNQINKDLANVVKNKQLIEDLKSVGIFPLVSVKPKDIQYILDNNDKIKSLIVKNNIRLK